MEEVYPADAEQVVVEEVVVEEEVNIDALALPIVSKKTRINKIRNDH